MRSVTVALGFALLLSCRERINGSQGDLRVAPVRLEFPAAFVGQVKQANVEVTNTGRSPRSATLRTSAPFAVEPATANLPGAATVAATVSFAPTAVGPFEARLTVEADDGSSLEVQLVGSAEPPLECVSRSACRSARFDLATGTCVESPVSDGVDCTSTSACWQRASCVQGECVGTPRSCEDFNECTTDVCDPARGCVPFPATARCAAPVDPCHVAACHPSVGCTFDNAPDGTRCGPADCSTAHVCILGECEEVPVREGAQCGDPSPCQALGRCTQGACVRPPPAPMSALWTVWAPPGERLLWDGIADSDGNIYWRERVPESPQARLRSVDPSGQTRWTVMTVASPQMALIDGVLLIRTPDGFEGRSALDGKLLWSRGMSSAVAVASPKTQSRGLGGSAYVGYAAVDSGVLLGSVVSAINVFNGARLWQHWLPEQDIEDPSMPVDENGYVYLGTRGNNGTRWYWSFSPLGAKRWSTVNAHASPAAVFGGRVYHWDHWLSETADGGFVNEEDPPLAGSGYPRLALGAISFVGTHSVDAGQCGMPEQVSTQAASTLVRVDPASSRERWRYTVYEPGGAGRTLTNPVLTSTSTVIFSQNVDYCAQSAQFVLREVSASGVPGFSCELPTPESYALEGLLDHGKWIATVHETDGGRSGVRAIPLPGFELPAHGWVTAWGSSARDNHAR